MTETEIISFTIQETLKVAKTHLQPNVAAGLITHIQKIITSTRQTEQDLSQAIDEDTENYLGYEEE